MSNIIGTKMKRADYANTVVVKCIRTKAYLRPLLTTAEQYDHTTYARVTWSLLPYLRAPRTLDDNICSPAIGGLVYGGRHIFAFAHHEIGPEAACHAQPRTTTPGHDNRTYTGIAQCGEP